MKPSNLKAPSFKKEWEFYFRYAGLGFIAAGLILYNSSRSRYLIGIGLLILAVSFMKKK